MSCSLYLPTATTAIVAFDCQEILALVSKLIYFNREKSGPRENAKKRQYFLLDVLVSPGCKAQLATQT